MLSKYCSGITCDNSGNSVPMDADFTSVAKSFISLSEEDVPSESNKPSSSVYCSAEKYFVSAFASTMLGKKLIKRDTIIPTNATETANNHFLVLNICSSSFYFTVIYKITLLLFHEEF